MLEILVHIPPKNSLNFWECYKSLMLRFVGTFGILFGNTTRRQFESYQMCVHTKPIGTLFDLFSHFFVCHIQCMCCILKPSQVYPALMQGNYTRRYFSLSLSLSPYSSRIVILFAVKSAKVQKNNYFYLCRVYVWYGDIMWRTDTILKSRITKVIKVCFAIWSLLVTTMINRDRCLRCYQYIGCER